MNRPLIFLVCIFVFSSCQSAGLIQDLQGTWKVTEVNYIYDSFTTSYYPTDQFFVFEEDNFRHEQNGIVDDNGTFIVNPKATVIVFTSALGSSKYNILVNNETEQHWRSKAKLVDFYMDFKLEKVQ